MIDPAGASRYLPDENTNYSQDRQGIRDKTYELINTGLHVQSLEESLGDNLSHIDLHSDSGFQSLGELYIMGKQNDRKVIWDRVKNHKDAPERLSKGIKDALQTMVSGVCARVKESTTEEFVTSITDEIFEKKKLGESVSNFHHKHLDAVQAKAEKTFKYKVSKALDQMGKVVFPLPGRVSHRPSKILPGG